MLDIAGLQVTAPAAAQTAETWTHALSLFGDIKYPADFKRFDYVNPDAPKGGVARQVMIGTFDSLNIALSSKGQPPAILGLIYESLMDASLDEPSTQYGLLAESVSHPDDHSSVTYRLRKDARWHDGKPITPADVVFSMDAFKKYNAGRAFYYQQVVKTEQVGERDVKFTFSAKGNRELPSIVGQLIVLPKHWWEGTDANGKPRDISQTTLEIPLGSGPYKVKAFETGRFFSIERVPDYWGAKLPIKIGQDNFDELRVDYFREKAASFQAFKADQIDWFYENVAKDWATAYDFPAVTQKRVVLEEFPVNNRGGMQAFFLNIRRDLFKDKRVRRAFNYVYDFEEMNKQLFFGKYKRTSSYFEGTELASSGVPVQKEFEILKEVYGDIPPEVIAKPYENPVNGNPENVRENRRQALRLMKEAGYEIRDQKMVDKDGKQVAVEFLTTGSTFERILGFYQKSLEGIGISVTIRSVDPIQYTNRVRTFDYDIIGATIPQSLSPGNEQRDFWGSQAADTPDSANYGGIKNPVIDMLIDKVVFATDRETLVAATKALDRVLLWHYYVVPQHTYGFTRVALWDRFSHAPLPKYGNAGLPSLWWFDKDKANKIGGRN